VNNVAEHELLASRNSDAPQELKGNFPEGNVDRPVVLDELIAALSAAEPPVSEI